MTRIFTMILLGAVCSWSATVNVTVAETTMFTCQVCRMARSVVVAIPLRDNLPRS